MGRVGFIQDKLEIKFLILYVAARLIEPVPFEAMQELTMCDDGIDFFDFSECLSNLVESQHLTLSDDGLYAITEKGLHNGAICESSLPYSVRLRADPVRHRAAPQRDLHGHARVQRRREPAHLEDGTDGSQGGHGQGPRRALPEKSRAALHRRFEHALLRTRRWKITYISICKKETADGCLFSACRKSLAEFHIRRREICEICFLPRHVRGTERSESFSKKWLCHFFDGIKRDSRSAVSFLLQSSLFSSCVSCSSSSTGMP